MDLRNTPDPRVDWDNINYTTASDAIRPEPGYRFCRKCGRLYAINHWNFSKRADSPDGYNYVCRKCVKLYHNERKQHSQDIEDDDIF